MRLNIYACEPYYGGSHKKWIDQLKRCSRHNFTLFTLPARYWKWRIHGSAYTLSEMLPAKRPDLILLTDMMDVSFFISLVRYKYSDVPVLLYFHENQFGYPWADSDKEKQAGREYHYQFINISSALSADHVVFNSQYHMNMFLQNIPPFFSRMPDYRINCIDNIRVKSSVLYPGIDLSIKSHNNGKNEGPVLVWNHRWEYDKNPEGFYQFLNELSAHNVPFKLVLLGQHNDKNPIYTSITEKYYNRIIHKGYASHEEYAKLLSLADYAPVFSNQDYFGISIMECCAAGIVPLLPKRLSYPELYGTVKEIFYSKKETAFEVFMKLQAMNTQIVRGKVQAISDPFQWKKLIDTYDDFFENIKLRH